VTATSGLSAAARGAMWMICASFCYVTASVCTRVLSAEFSVQMIVFVRCIIALAFIAPVLSQLKLSELRTRRLSIHLLRTFLSWAGMMGWFYAVKMIPIADYYALAFLTPIFTIAMAVAILHERATIATWVAVGFGFLGALIVLRPGFTALNAGMVGAVVAAAAFAGVNLCVRVASREDRGIVIVMYVNLLLLPISGAAAVFDWKMPTWDSLPYFLGVGIFATLGQLFLTWAVGLADARIVQPFDFCRLPIAAAVGWVLFHETTDIWTWVGAVEIFASAYNALFAERRQKA
jgi:drug/metabolite transporter (DMT)-like permease